jgi:hypothetical protein
MDEFFNAVQLAVKDYETEYRPMYQKMKEEREQGISKKKEQDVKKLKRDLASNNEEGGESSCFIRSGAGQGLSLRLDDDDDDDDTSSDEEENEDKNAASTLGGYYF